MTTRKIADRLASLCREGKNHDVINEQSRSARLTVGSVVRRVLRSPQTVRVAHDGANH